MIRKILIIAILALFSCLLIFRNQIVSAAATKQLSSVFTGSKVSIGSSSLDFSSLKLNNILIQNKKFPYKIEAGSVAIEFSVSSLIKRSLNKVGLSEIDIAIDAKQKTLQDLIKSLVLKEGGFKYRSLVVSDIKTAINLLNITTDLSLSIKTNLVGDSFNIDYLRAEAKFSSIYGVKIVSLDSELSSENSDNKFRIKELSFNKAKLTNFNAVILLSMNFFNCESVNFDLFSGKVTGTANLGLSQLAYSANLEIAGLDLEQVGKDFELKEKVEMSGIFDGFVRVEGKNTEITKIEGRLTSRPEGGKFIIKDENMLAALRPANNQRIQLTLSALEDFTYQTGKITLEKDEDNIVVNLLLDGDKGRIQLPLVWHGLL